MLRIPTLAAFFLVAFPVVGQTPYLLEETLTPPSVVKAVFVDLDETGNLGLTVASEGSPLSPTDNGRLTFYLYQQGETGPASYSEPIPALTTEYSAIGSFDLADFVPDAIGYVDGVVAGSRSGQPGVPLGSITTFQNDGFPFLPLAERQMLLSGLRDVRIAQLADLTGDDVLDVVSFYLDADNVGQAVYFPGDGTGDFGAATAIAPAGLLANVRGADFADLDGDDDLDVVATNNSSATAADVVVLINNGDGTFAAPLSLDEDLASPQDVAVGDLSGDGSPDVVAAGQTDGLVVYYAGNGDGTFGPRQVAASDEVGVNNLALGDTNGDGTIDVATAASFDGSRFAVYLNLGGGVFAPPFEVAEGTTPREILLGDVEQDGDLDLFTGDRGGAFTFYRKTSQGFPVVAEAPEGLEPLAIALAPNPVAGGIVRLGVEVGLTETVRVTLHDALGRRVAVLHDGPGPRALTLDAGTLPAGPYLVRAEAGGVVSTQTLTVLGQ